MAEETVVHIGENSPEHVAYRLMREVLLNIEEVSFRDIDRKTYLDTYKECLDATKGLRRRA